MARTEPSRIWAGILTQSERIVRAMFEVSTTVQIGNGLQTLFWRDKWIDGSSVVLIPPAVNIRLQRSRLVAHALPNDSWVSDITGSLTLEALAQYIDLWGRLQGVHLNEAVPDKFIWKWSLNQQYSASSAYRAFFLGQCGLPGAKELAKTRAPPSSKFFIWTALLGRCWTSDRLQRHGLQNNGPCVLCSQATETVEHLLLNCVYSREIWFTLLRRVGSQHLCPVQEDSLAEWWLRRRKLIHSDSRKCFDCFVVLVRVGFQHLCPVQEDSGSVNQI
jgi:hypothetical protein